MKYEEAGLRQVVRGCAEDMECHGKPPLASAHGSVVWKACGIKHDMSGISTLTIEYVRPMTLAEVIADVERRHPDLGSISAVPQNGELSHGVAERKP